MVALPDGWENLPLPGVNILTELLDLLRSEPNLTTGALLERWRDRMTNGDDDALRSFCEQSGAAAEPLVELLERIRSAPNERIEKGLRRQLFREIHDALMAATQDDRISR